jgi:methyl-accepting chemotaxis protein
MSNDKKTIGINPFKSMDKKATQVTRTSIARQKESGSGVELTQNVQEILEINETLGKNAHRLEKQTNHASVSIKQLSSHVVSVGESVEKMRGDLKKLSNNVSQTTKASLTALKTSDSTNSVFSSFLDSSKELDKIDKVVATLAQQINIFALNASIEAARSGEAGRGFTVVANEIKELSKETFKIAEDIRVKIDSFFSDAKEAINALGEISNLVIQIKNNQSVMEDALKEQLDELNEMGKNTNSLVRASNAVTDNILNVYKLSKVNTEAVERAIRTSHSLTRIAGALPVSEHVNEDNEE